MPIEFINPPKSISLKSIRSFGMHLLTNARRNEMSNSFMSPLPTFTLESLVTNGQWTAAQNNARKKGRENNWPDQKRASNSGIQH